MKNFNDFLNTISRKYENLTLYSWIESETIQNRTYGEFCNDVLAKCFECHQLFGERKTIALIGDLSYSWMCTFFGIILSNHVAVPIDNKLLPEEMAARIDFADVSAVYVSDRYSQVGNILTKCTKTVSILPLENNHTDLKNDLCRPVSLDENAAAVMMFTSGTTGDGLKAAMLTQKNILADVLGSVVGFGNPTERILSVLPIHHCFELFVGQMKYMYLGCHLCINDDLKKMIDNIRLFKINRIVAVPAIAKLVASTILKLKSEGYARDEIREYFGGELNWIGIGGASVEKESLAVLKSAGITVFVGYGLTETAGGCLINYDAADHPLAAGKAYVKGMKIKTAPDGEILLKGDNIMLGYYKNPILTNAVIDEDGWFHTGDLGEIDHEGYVTIHGRKDNMIKTGSGEKIYPEELESRLLQIEGISMAMVCLYEGSLTALLYLLDDSEKKRKKIRKAIQKLNDDLENYEKIMVVYFYEHSFPMTTSMKIKRKEVFQNLDIKPECEMIQPENDFQQTVLKKAESVLPNIRFGITDNLFALGMDSLTVIQLSMLLNCDPSVIYECKTIKALSDALDCKLPEKEDKISGINDYIRNEDNENEAGPQYVLLTGAAGYLGMHLLAELRSADIQVVCLVRDAESFKRKVEYYFPDMKELQETELVIGDITKDHLGLCKTCYDDLIKKVDSVFHAAALVSHVCDLSKSYDVNVCGTKNVIEFCKKSRSKLYFMSSYAVSGFSSETLLTENVLDIGQKIANNPYIQTKYQAEEQVLLSRKNGVRSTIFRIGNLTARAKDGKFQINANENGMLAQLRAFRFLGIYPESMAETYYDFTSVDEAARAIVLLSRNKKTGHIWHIMNNHVSSLKQLMSDKAIPVNDSLFTEKINEHKDNRDVAVLSVYYKMMQQHFNPKFSLNVTLKALEMLRFKWSE